MRNEPTAHPPATVPDVSPARGLLIPHGYLHRGNTSNAKGKVHQ